MPTPPIPLTVTYVDPDGSPWDLSDLSMKNGYVCSAISGIEGFPVMAQTIPYLDGTSMTNVYIPQPGTIGLAILVARPMLHDHDSENDYYALLDRVVRAFLCRRNELPQPGKLIVTRPDGSQRQINTFTTSGFDTPEVGKDDKTLYTFALSTPDPYWQDLTPKSFTFGTGTALGILPINFVSSGILFNNTSLLGAATTLTNQGTGLTYPVWNITGPGTPTVTNNTTGRSWALNQPVPAGQTVMVVTQRGQQQVVNMSTGGTNLWSWLAVSTPRDLWPLVGGPNKVTISMPGNNANSRVNVQWTNRWQRA